MYYQEVTQFTRWLRCKHPQTSTHWHYASDLQQFFTWANKPPKSIADSPTSPTPSQPLTGGWPL